MFSPSVLSYGFLGTGMMASALIKSFLESKTLKANKIFVYNRSQLKQKKLVTDYQVQATESCEELLAKAEVIFICVKPQDLKDLLDDIAPYVRPEQTLICIAAASSYSFLKKYLSNTDRLVRLIPNTACQVFKGLFPFYTESVQKESLSAFVEILFQNIGRAFPVSTEELLSHLTVLSSSGLAFVLEFLSLWAEALEEAGLDSQNSRQLSLDTFIGACVLAQKFSQKDFSALQSQIASKKGLTQEALNTMRSEGLDRVLKVAFEKALLKEKSLFNKIQ